MAREQKTVKVGEDVVFLCVGPYCWGKGNSETEAKKKAREHGSTFKTYNLYLVPKDAYVDDMGCIHWKDGSQPCILLKRVRDGKEQDITKEE